MSDALIKDLQQHINYMYVCYSNIKQHKDKIKSNNNSTRFYLKLFLQIDIQR